MVVPAAELPGMQVNLSSLSSADTINNDGSYSFTGGSPTIKAEGSSTVQCSSSTATQGAGIYVAQGSPVTASGTSCDFTITQAGSYTFTGTATGSGEAESTALSFYTVSFETNGGTFEDGSTVTVTATANRRLPLGALDGKQHGGKHQRKLFLYPDRRP